MLALVQSIYMLLGALEADKRELLGTLGSKQVSAVRHCCGVLTAEESPKEG